MQYCSANANSDDGISTGAGSTVAGCAAAINAGDGIIAGDGSTIRNSSAYTNGNDGFVLIDACTISGCTAADNTRDGIRATEDCLIIRNNCTRNGPGGGGIAAGIHTTGPHNRIEDNSLTFNSRGIWVEGTNSFIIKNFASGFVPLYLIAADNKVGVIPLVPNSPAINNGLDTPAGVGTTNPWANFRF